MPKLLELRGISKSFPGIKALDNISLSLEKGEIHALLGENGAGKSTLMKIMCGVYNNDEGEILLDGEKVVFSNYKDAINKGIGIIFQEFSLIPYMNTVENIFLNREIKNKFGLIDYKTMKAETKKLLDSLDIHFDVDVPVNTLSVADQQFIEISKALSLNARILVLDEPTATLTPKEAERLFRIMRALKEKGVGMFFISHHLEEIFQICDNISVLRDGQYIGSRSIKDCNTDELVEMMVGRKLTNTYPVKTHTITRNAPVLEVKDLQLTKNSKPNSFKLYPGEILGFSGLVGAGRTELARAMMGADPCYKKEVFIDGRKEKLNSPSEALEKGIGLLPENRKVEGLILPFSVKDNISMNNFSKWMKAGMFIDGVQERLTANKIISDVRIKTPTPDTPVMSLSGGNQQKVVIGRWLNNDCKVLIFDEPTRGIDVGAKSEIYEIMRRLTDEGMAVIMISSELPEIVGVCDRVEVFREGNIVADLTGDDINSTTIMRYATGN
ncbi:MAG: sugar ABC transporter ATP-binding protein [Succinivibrio sp.]|nr:sugar ABC transporter ATP-binding protein [Succinivibrio sp.]